MTSQEKIREAFEKAMASMTEASYPANETLARNLAWMGFQLGVTHQQQARMSREEVAQLISNFWDLHATEPSSGFHPEELVAMLESAGVLSVKE